MVRLALAALLVLVSAVAAHAQLISSGLSVSGSSCITVSASGALSIPVTCNPTLAGATLTGALALGANTITTTGAVATGNVTITATSNAPFTISAGVADLYPKVAMTNTSRDAAWQSSDGTNNVFAGILSASGCGVGSWAVFVGGGGGCVIKATQAGAVAVPVSLAIGGSTPTAITNIRVYTPSLTPAQTAASLGLAEQTFTVTGLTTADKVYVNGPVATALCPPVTYRVSSADTLAIGFVDLTAALCTPAAGTYTVVAIRS